MNMWFCVHSGIGENDWYAGVECDESMDDWWLAEWLMGLESGLECTMFA